MGEIRKEGRRSREKKSWKNDFIYCFLFYFLSFLTPLKIQAPVFFYYIPEKKENFFLDS